METKKKSKVKKLSVVALIFGIFFVLVMIGSTHYIPLVSELYYSSGILQSSTTYLKNETRFELVKSNVLPKGIRLPFGNLPFSVGGSTISMDGGPPVEFTPANKFECTIARDHSKSSLQSDSVYIFLAKVCKGELRDTPVGCYFVYVSDTTSEYVAITGWRRWATFYFGDGECKGWVLDADRGGEKERELKSQGSISVFVVSIPDGVWPVWFLPPID